MEGSGNEPKIGGLQESTESHRFWLAVVLVGGFVLILLVAMVGGYEEPSALAGIFSGWIVAIIGFYFIQQASDRAAQQQALIISDGTKTKLDMLQEKSEESVDEVGTEAANVAKERDFWKNKATEFRNLLIEVDPSLKSEEDKGPDE